MHVRGMWAGGSRATLLSRYLCFRVSKLRAIDKLSEGLPTNMFVTRRGLGSNPLRAWTVALQVLEAGSLDLLPLPPASSIPDLTRLQRTYWLVDPDHS